MPTCFGNKPTYLPEADFFNICQLPFSKAYPPAAYLFLECQLAWARSLLSLSFLVSSLTLPACFGITEPYFLLLCQQLVTRDLVTPPLIAAAYFCFVCMDWIEYLMHNAVYWIHTRTTKKVDEYVLGPYIYKYYSQHSLNVAMAVCSLWHWPSLTRPCLNLKPKHVVD